MKTLTAPLTLLIPFISFMTHGADIEMGKARAGICASCHGDNGIGLSPLYANLAGQKAPYLVKQLQNFKEGTRSDPTMSIFAKQLSDTDIDNLAAYYESLSADGKNNAKEKKEKAKKTEEPQEKLKNPEKSEKPAEKGGNKLSKESKESKDKN